MSSTIHQREQEHAQPARHPGPTSARHAERERRVGRHGCPSRGRLAPWVDRQIEAWRTTPPRRRPAGPAAPPVAQLTHVELAPDLEADDEEEEHQPVVDPVRRSIVSSEFDRRHLGVPERPVVSRPWRVRPDQGGERRQQQGDEEAGVLGGDELGGRGGQRRVHGSVRAVIRPAALDVDTLAVDDHPALRLPRWVLERTSGGQKWGSATSTNAHVRLVGGIGR